MFERFDESARLTVVRAQEEARRANQTYIGTEHLLLGVMDVGNSVARKTLTALGVGVEDVRRDVEGIIGRGPEPPSGHIPFTPQSKKVLELSVQEARQLGHEFVGTGHILLSLLREGSGVAGRVLSGRGIDLGQLRVQVSQLLTDRSAGPSPAARPAADDDLETGTARDAGQTDGGEVGRLRAENERLRALLRAHGIDPGTEYAG
jgi:ATP-dependent Clp protease ATP-binding subunit ClpC